MSWPGKLLDRTPPAEHHLAEAQAMPGAAYRAGKDVARDPLEADGAGELAVGAAAERRAEEPLA